MHIGTVCLHCGVEGSATYSNYSNTDIKRVKSEKYLMPHGCRTPKQEDDDSNLRDKNCIKWDGREIKFSELKI